MDISEGLSPIADQLDNTAASDGDTDEAQQQVVRLQTIGLFPSGPMAVGASAPRSSPHSASSDDSLLEFRADLIAAVGGPVLYESVEIS
jgi:hypothetical protein